MQICPKQSPTRRIFGLFFSVFSRLFSQRTSRIFRQVFLACMAFGAGVLVTHHATSATANQSPYQLLEQFSRVLVWIENEYVDPVDRNELIEGSIKGMVAELDPHSSYLPPEDYAIFQADTEGRFGGIGVEVDFGDEYVTIIAPIEGSPAERAGIRPGDRILAIDNISVRGRSSADLVRQMRGEAGTRVLLTVRRAGGEKLLYFTLTRQVISVASIASKLLKDDVGYLRIKTFQSGTHSEFVEHLGRLRDKASGDLTGVVLDMRNNPGGLVNEASAIADEFLSAGTIFTTRRRGSIVDEVVATGGGALRRGPVVVLVNEYSASAAELVAGALQDSKRAPVVGAKTFGKGSVQTIIDLPGGAGLRLTTLRYYTPSGRAIQAQGVDPDIAVASPGVIPSFGVLREENLDNHLPAVEGAIPNIVQPSSEAPPEVDGGVPESAETTLGVSRDVPVDPTKGEDAALSIAYRVVTGTLHSAPKAATKGGAKAPAKGGTK
jgi:carboxyl-terminal processing protease